MTKSRNSATKKKDSNKSGGINRHFHSLNPDRVASGHGMRSKATIKRLQMYRNFKPKRDRRGKILKEAPFQGKLASGTVARVAPDRRWFGNTRLISQDALQKFQEELKKSSENPYEIILKRTQLPITLLNESSKYKRVHLLDIESFQNTFGPKAQRKRPKIGASNMEEYFALVSSKSETFQAEVMSSKSADDNVDDMEKQEALHPIFKAGTSKRIWNELYKVIDSSDVVLEVLDARDPMGTRCKEIEAYLRKEKPHKHVVLVMNKCDLVPVTVTKRWLQILSKEYPTIIFRASIMNAFGKSSLINLLRQYALLHKEHKQISVGLIGYPNVGKSSIINALKKKNVCNVAPIAGETKVWQYVTLMKRIYLIDCPGIVYPRKNSDTDLILKGVIRVENVPDPEHYIDEVLRRVKTEHLEKTYGIHGWKDASEFMEMLAKHYGRLLKGGEPDLNGVARIVLNDFQRAKLPHFVAPPEANDATDDNSKTKAETRIGDALKETSSVAPRDFMKHVDDNDLSVFDNEEINEIMDYLIESTVNSVEEEEEEKARSRTSSSDSLYSDISGTSSHSSSVNESQRQSDDDHEKSVEAAESFLKTVDDDVEILTEKKETTYSEDRLSEFVKIKKKMRSNRFLSVMNSTASSANSERKFSKADGKSFKRSPTVFLKERILKTSSGIFKIDVL